MGWGSLVGSEGSVHLLWRELLNLTSWPTGTIVRKGINLQHEFHKCSVHNSVKVSILQLTSQRLDVRQQGIFSKGAEISTFRFPGQRDEGQGWGTGGKEVGNQENHILSVGTEWCNSTLPGILLNFRLKTADDFLISPRKRKRSSSRSLSPSCRCMYNKRCYHSLPRPTSHTHIPHPPA